MGGFLPLDTQQTVTIVITGPTPKKRWREFTDEMGELLDKYASLHVRLKSIVNERIQKPRSRRRLRATRRPKR
jgi:hypothetical protein